jgi:TetR/AcrR family transcriptional regulator, copper-responsive repressor
MIAVGQYAEVAQRYAKDNSAALAAALDDPRSLRETLRAIYAGAAEFYRIGDDGPRGCFLVGTTVTEAARDKWLRSLIDSTLDRFTDLFRARFEQAARDGELTPSPSPEALAEIATATLTNLALRTRTAAKGDVIDRLIEATVEVICRPHVSPPSAPTMSPSVNIH